MKLNPQDLEKIVSLTLDHYNQRADEFWQGTRDHDVKQNIAALLQWIEGKAPFTILDFGCGPGRDLKVFSELGHIAVGLEGAAHFVTIARTYSGCEVWLQNFLKLDLPDNHFDGVYANASLFHVPSQELPRVQPARRSRCSKEVNKRLGLRLIISNARNQGLFIRFVVRKTYDQRAAFPTTSNSSERAGAVARCRSLSTIRRQL